ncbi:MAG: response regulator transcription factor [Anaerolineae bacterium]|jgi:DNA-binding response OmpR family regulator
MSHRILFVEKDVTIADLLVPSLERGGFRVTVAQTQRQAQTRIRALRPDLLVIDVASFGANGYKVSDAVRGRLDSVPTVLLLEQGHEGAGSTAEAFMTPPFTSRKLLYRVRKLAKHLTSREIQVGDLVLDPDTRLLQVGGQTERLRPKEAALMACFMNNPGRVLSREEIMKKVWETDYIGDTRTLSVHVHWLRKMIEEDPGHPQLLRTVRGVGYRFDVPDR